MRSYDVVIMGGGIAGAFLARHLKLVKPELSVLVIEAQHKIDNYKVGESTVEVAAHYMIRRLNLGTYLYQHQLPKNGLRFFFDTPEKDLPLTRMSEIGSDHMPFHPSFQLERAALERDLAVMNAEIGVEVVLGAKVTDFTLDGAGKHTVTYEHEGETREVGCRWLCDAAGRRHLIHRKLGNKVTKESRLATGAAWGRYRNVAGLDAVMDPAWRGRVRHTSRHLSTNHMMYDGYWLWFIPLAGDLMSVGAVFDKDRVKGPRTKDEFETFMRSHRSSRDLMEGAIFEDFQAYAHLPYHSEVFFSKDRWALTGEAGAFTDPFYSPGSDFIATANEFTVSMILSELDGDTAAFHEKVEAYNAYYKFKYESVIRLYIKMYPIFGSYEIYRLKYLLDFNNYYNLVVWPYMAGKLTDVKWIRDELGYADRILQAISSMADHFSKLGETLRSRGEYHAQNEGRWANGLNGVAQFETRLGPQLDPEFRRAECDKAFGSVFAAVLERAMQQPGLGQRQRVLSELALPQVLLFKDINDENYQKFMQRLAGKLARELKVEFPDAGIERVVMNGNGESGSAVSVIGVHEDAPEHARILARARELWDTQGQSLAQIQM